MSSYLDLIEQTRTTVGAKQEWSAINAEYAVRMKLQNRFKTGLEIAQYTADIMRLAWFRCSASHDECQEAPANYRP